MHYILVPNTHVHLRTRIRLHPDKIIRFYLFFHLSNGGGRVEKKLTVSLIWQWQRAWSEISVHLPITKICEIFSFIELTTLKYEQHHSVLEKKKNKK